MTQLADFAPPTIAGQAARLQSRQRFFNLVVTNVPGPQFPLYLLGRRMERVFPMVPLAKRQARLRRDHELRRPGQLRPDRRLRRDGATSTTSRRTSTRRSRSWSRPPAASRGFLRRFVPGSERDEVAAHTNGTGTDGSTRAWTAKAGLGVAAGRALALVAPLGVFARLLQRAAGYGTPRRGPCASRRPRWACRSARAPGARSSGVQVLAARHVVLGARLGVGVAGVRASTRSRHGAGRGAREARPALCCAVRPISRSWVAIPRSRSHWRWSGLTERTGTPICWAVCEHGRRQLGTAWQWWWPLMNDGQRRKMSVKRSSCTRSARSGRCAAAGAPAALELQVQADLDPALEQGLGVAVLALDHRADGVERARPRPQRGSPRCTRASSRSRRR